MLLQLNVDERPLITSVKGWAVTGRADWLLCDIRRVVFERTCSPMKTWRENRSPGRICGRIATRVRDQLSRKKIAIVVW